MAWLYKKKITITGETSAGTDYQVLLKVGESSGATGEDFDLEENSEDFPAAIDDGGDINFYSDSGGTTALKFWVEEITGTTPNRMARIWVKVTADLGTDKDIYIYYGNAAASNLSDGDNTFIYYNDLTSDPSISDKTDWAYEIFSFTATTQFAFDAVYEATSVKVAAAATNGFWYTDSSSTNVPNSNSYFVLTSDTDQYGTPPGIDTYGASWAGFTVSTIYRMSYRRDGASRETFLDDVSKGAYASGDTVDSDRLMIQIYNGGGADGSVYYDGANDRVIINNHRTGTDGNLVSYIKYPRIRKFQTAEPAFASAGAQQGTNAVGPFPTFFRV